MQYDYIAIPQADVPRAAGPLFQHLLDTYAGEGADPTNSVAAAGRK